MTRATTKSSRRKKAGPERRMIAGRQVVLLDEAEYQRLREKADEWEPGVPSPDADGNYPAIEYARVSLARKIIRDRRHLGLTQAELARRAGIRPETLSRIEHALCSPSIRTIEKLDRALLNAESHKRAVK